MAKIKLSKALDTTQEVLALGIYEDETNQYETTNPDLHAEIKEAIKKKRFTLKKNSFYTTRISNSTYRKIAIICLGKKKQLDEEILRRAMSIAVQETKAEKSPGFTTNIAAMAATAGLKDEKSGQAIAEGILLSDYSFSKYQKKKADIIKEATIKWEKPSKQFLTGIERGTIIAEATNNAKDMGNEPANIATPEYLEKKAREIAKETGMKITVLKRKDLEKKGMGGILAVSSAGKDEPRLIILEYRGGGKGKTALVGKGITFDTGGIHLKPEGGIEDMKIDMAGGAAVLGTMKAIAKLKPKANIIGIVPTCQNLISENAYNPGDIITMYNKKTVEILNTDAEGRMILADALTYAEKDVGADIIIDVATLTGACMVALGYEASGLITDDDELGQELLKAGEETKDRVWPLPFYEEFHDKMDGEITDFRNLSDIGRGGRIAGAITAGVFLKKFVEKSRWAHIDIAGPSYLPKQQFYKQKNATGAGVRLLVEYFMKQ